MKRNYPEYELHRACIKYLELQHNVLFDSDTIAAVKLTLPQAGRNKAIQKQGFARPDVAIYQPNFYYHGLFIELKVKSPFKKDGTLLKNEHLEAQQRTIDNLNSIGYFATFATGLDEFIEIVDDYMLHVHSLKDFK